MGTAKTYLSLRWAHVVFCRFFRAPAQILNIWAHETMVLFVFRKLILQTRMCSQPMGLDVWFLVGPFVYFHTSCVRTAKALARLRRCAGSPEPCDKYHNLMSWLIWKKNLTANKKVLMISDNPSVIHLFLILRPRFWIVKLFISDTNCVWKS